MIVARPTMLQPEPEPGPAPAPAPVPQVRCVPSQYVRLDVGGTRYTTMLSTLCKYPGSMLAAMFSGLLESGDDDGSSVIDDGGGVGLAVDSDGAYIIDRDGPSFRHVLAYLRNQREDVSIPLPSDDVERRRLAQEADYFMLEGLSRQCHGAVGTTRSVSHSELLSMINTSSGAPLSLPLTDLREVSMAYQTCAHFNLRACNLAGVDLRETDFQNADLRDAILDGANMQGANLSGALLEGTSLSQTNLAHASLTGAVLTRAVMREVWGLESAVFDQLRGADLSGADLTRVPLSGKDLSGCSLAGANLRGANLRETQLREASLAGADLVGVRDLSYVSGFSAGRGGGQVQSWSACLEGVDLEGAIVDDELFQHLQAFQQQQLEAALASMSTEHTGNTGSRGHPSVPATALDFSLSGVIRQPASVGSGSHHLAA